MAGCFDVIHSGHVELFRKAKAIGGVVIAALPSDDVVRRLKGSERPIHSLDDRMAVVTAMRWVDHVVYHDEATSERLVEMLGIDVVVKGADWSGRSVPESSGCRLVILDSGVATTSGRIIDKIKGV